MQALLSNRLVLVVLGVLSYVGTTVALLRPHRFLPPATHAETAAPAAPVAVGPSWNFSNPEMDQLLAELRRERENLALREKQLNEWALRLQAERLEINQVTQTVHRMQMELDRTILRVKEEETANLKKLARLYATMSPEGAMNILRAMPDDSVLKIFTFMKESETAPILEAMSKVGPEEVKRVAAMTERLRLTLSRNGASPSAK